MLGLFLLGCGPAVRVPGGGGADEGSGGATGASTAETSVETDAPSGSEGADGDATSGSSSTGAEACACLDQRLDRAARAESPLEGTLIQAVVTETGAVWIREETAEGGGVVVRYGEDGDFTAWPDQHLSLHAPARMTASAAGAALGEFVPLDEVWRLQLFDNEGLRICYLDRDALLLPTLPPPGGWAFLQPGLVATRLPASCDVDQAETLSLAEVPADLDIVDAVWTSEVLVVLGARSTGSGRAPFAAAIDRLDGSLRATTHVPPPSLGHRWTPSNESILLTLHDEETVEAHALAPDTGALSLLGEVDGAGVTDAIALPHPTDPWLLLDGDDPRVVRLSADACCPPMALVLEGSSVDVHAARRIDDALVLVRELDDGAHMLSQETFALE